MIKKHKRKLRLSKAGKLLVMALLLLIIGLVIFLTRSCKKGRKDEFIFPKNSSVGEPNIEEKLLTVNDFSRPGTKLDKINSIVIHYTANPGTTAIQNRNYFEGLKDGHATSVSSHYIIGLKGEIVQCVPCNEIAYASNKRNKDTLSIECCHENKDGKFTTSTYESLVKLTAWLCVKYKVNPQKLLRHYDITGKICPKYYVDHEDKWEAFKKDVEERILLK